MAVKYLKAEKQVNQFYFVVLIDDTQVNADGTPKEEYVKEFSWTIQTPEGQTETEYLANIKKEIQLLADHEVGKMTSTALTGF
jgi:hypothetical protein